MPRTIVGITDFILAQRFDLIQTCNRDYPLGFSVVLVVHDLDVPFLKEYTEEFLVVTLRVIHFFVHYFLHQIPLYQVAIEVHIRRLEFLHSINLGLQ